MFDYFNLSDTKDYEYLLRSIGKDVTKNGTVIRALITNTELEQSFDDRRISSLIPFKRGDVIQYEDKPYMVISEINTTRYNKYKGVMRSLPFSIIFNKNCVYSTVQCYIETEGFRVQSGQILSTARGTIELYAPDNEAARSISIDDRFIKHGVSFKVTGIDRYSRPGIVIIVATKDGISPSVDDLINEVADGLTCIVSITNSKPMNVLKGSTGQITRSNSKPVTYVSSDPNIATVSSTGLVTGINEGIAIITVTSVANQALKDTIQVNIALPDNFTISASADKTSLRYDQSAIVTNQVLNNGRNVPDAPVSYAIVYADMKTPVPTSIATIAVQNNREAIVRNVNRGIPEDVNVKVTLNSDPSITAFIKLSLDYYREPNYNIEIYTGHTPANEVAYNDDIFLGKFIYNNGYQEDNHTVTWSLVQSDQVSPVPASIASITLEDTSNQINVHNNNETGTDANIYVKAVLNGVSGVTAYYALKVVSKIVVIQKSVTIASTTTESPYTAYPPATNDSIIYGKTKSYTVKTTPANEPVTWKMTYETGTASTYGKIQSQTATSCTVLAGPYQTKTGIVRLTATLVSDPTIKQDYLIRIAGF